MQKHTDGLYVLLYVLLRPQGDGSSRQALENPQVDLRETRRRHVVVSTDGTIAETKIVQGPADAIKVFWRDPRRLALPGSLAMGVLLVGAGKTTRLPSRRRRSPAGWHGTQQSEQSREIGVVGGNCDTVQRSARSSQNQV